MAEALRELGLLGEAKELILKTTFNPKETNAAQFILKLIEAGDTKVRQILFKWIYNIEGLTSLSRQIPICNNLNWLNAMAEPFCFDINKNISNSNV